MALPRVFFDMTADGDDAGRIVMELRPDVVPKTAENFQCSLERNLVCVALSLVILHFVNSLNFL